MVKQIKHNRVGDAILLLSLLLFFFIVQQDYDDDMDCGKTSPDELGLERLALLSTNGGSDKVKQQPLMEGCRPAEPPLKAGSAQGFSSANEHFL